MVNEIKPIETVYNGYRFRSRLEARWAVFFDAAGIKYEYEPEGYEVDDIKYLPDFYLPDFDAHVEVKPDRPGFEADILKCKKMIRWGSPIKTIIFLGDVPPDSDGGHWHFPAFYYQTGLVEGGNVLSGWWFFQDSYDDNDNVRVVGHISGSRYPCPFDEEDGKLLGRYVQLKNESGYGFNWIHLAPSTKPLSDKYLRDKYKPWGSNGEMAESVMNCNEQFYKALRKARQARFEHGECG